MKVSFSTFLLVVALGLGALIAGRYLYFKPKFIQGARAPDFEAPGKDGQPIRLSALRGNYILLDFWGSWCGPCRRQSPELVKLYQKYGDKTFRDGSGFRLLSVGIEQDKDRWKQAILQDGLSWSTHILDQSSSLRFFNGPIAALYSVRQVPSSFLINPDGYIMGVNLEPEALDRLLSKR